MGILLFLLCYGHIVHRSIVQLKPSCSPCLWGETMVLIEVMISFSSFDQASKLSESHFHIYDVEALNERAKTQRISGYLSKNGLVELIVSE